MNIRNNISILVTLCIILSCSQPVLSQYEDVRCKCICPSTSVVSTSADPTSDRKLYIGNVAPNKCACEYVVMPTIGDPNVKEGEFCPRCECRYERRNTRTIRVCVILLIWVIAVLTLYMGFLRCLDPLLNKRRSGAVKYQEHMNEDVNLGEFGAEGTTSGENEIQNRARRSGSGVLDKVGAQQDKWKRQVQEQRRNIYDKRTMLN